MNRNVRMLLPHAVVALWLAYLGAAIWLHASHSVQTPIYDALSYLEKARNFWQAIDDGEFIEALRVTPTVRPHGTILLTYPFGFTADYNGYFFRSVYLPILLLVAALYVAAGRERIRSNAWWVATIALLLSSLPMFYGFDWRNNTSATVRWGFVDGFHGAVAALSAAALLRSVASLRLWPLGIAAALAALTLLIKPSGLMVMALVGLVWLMFVVVDAVQAKRAAATGRISVRYVAGGMGLFALFYAAVLAFSWFSGYLSPANFAYAQQALKVMEHMLWIPATQFATLLYRSAGVALVLWCSAIGALLVYQHRRTPASATAGSTEMKFAWWSAIAALVLWGLGAWYWLVIQAGGSQIRYFFPFLLMGVVCVLPAAFEIWPRTARWPRIALMALCALPALNIGALLAAGDDPPQAWQRLSGVSVEVGQDQEEVAQARAFIAALRQQRQHAELYSFASGQAAIFFCVGMFEELVHPKLPTFHVKTPQDWVQGFAVKVDAITSTDYILIRKAHNRNPDILLPHSTIRNFGEERLAFEAWLATLNQTSGIEVVSVGEHLRLLRVTDRTALDRSMRQFVALHTWRPEFISANQGLEEKWWNAEAVAARNAKFAMRDVAFGDVYKLHALAIERVDNGIKIEAWWEELRHENANDHRFLFLHLIDASGAILHNSQIALHPYDPPDGERKWRYGSETFMNVFPNPKLASLAFGVYQTNVEGGGFILGDKVPTDWGGKRIVVPLPGQQIAAAPAPATTQ